MNRELLEKLASLERRIGALERQERPAPVVAVYGTNAGQSIGNDSDTIVNFEDVVVDTHGAVTTGAGWHFTAPLAGVYAVAVCVLFVTTTAWAETEFARLRLYADGAAAQIITLRTGLDSSAAAGAMQVNGIVVVNLAAGAQIDVRVFQNSGGPLALNASGNFNHIGIFRIH